MTYEDDQQRGSRCTPAEIEFYDETSNDAFEIANDAGRK